MDWSGCIKADLFQPTQQSPCCTLSSPLESTVPAVTLLYTQITTREHCPSSHPAVQPVHHCLAEENSLRNDMLFHLAESFTQSDVQVHSSNPVMKVDRTYCKRGLGRMSNFILSISLCGSLSLALHPSPSILLSLHPSFSLQVPARKSVV